MAQFIDRNGTSQQVELDVNVYREAQDSGMSVASYINQKFPTQANDAPAFQQLCASSGIFMKEDRKNGIQATRLRDVMEGTGPCAASTPATRDNVPTSRILFPAAILSTIEDKLAEDLTTTASAFDRMVAVTESIEGTEFKRAILNFDAPEAGRSMQTAQLAAPRNMLTLTASDRSQSIPTEALGIQWSDKVETGIGLDIVALSVARQVAVQRNARAYENVLALLNGDEDLDMAALSTVSGAYVTAATLDSTVTKTQLTQTAWVKWLYGVNIRQSATINWIITDIDGALMLEKRTGRPVITGDDGTSPRINTMEKIANPLIPANVNVFVTDSSSWPAGTFLGLDSRYAIQRINSLSAEYNATQDDLIRRSRAMRWDSGSAAMRLFDQSYSVLTMPTS